MLFASILFVETNLKIYISHAKIRNKKYKIEIRNINAQIKLLEKKYQESIDDIYNTAEFKLMQDSKMIRKRELEVYNHTQHEKRLIEAQHDVILQTYQKAIESI